MSPYLISLCFGLAVGIAYGFSGVRSPAPPMIALIGLLGMLAGEAAISWAKGHPDAWANLWHSKSFAIPKSDAPRSNDDHA
ncbi:XapX domain-containing protein [Bacillus sp. NP157]|nr:XapX domain-containing protein [Bacillus sp. NP157]